MCEKIDDSGVIQGAITCMARPKAEHSLLWAGTSPPHCLQRVYVGLRSLCVALCHFVLVYVQFVLVYVGLCWFMLVWPNWNTNRFQGARPKLPDYCDDDDDDDDGGTGIPRVNSYLQ